MPSSGWLGVKPHFSVHGEHIYGHLGFSEKKTLLQTQRHLAGHLPPPSGCKSLVGGHPGGSKKRGEENLTKDTPSEKGFWTPLRRVFHPLGRHCSGFPVQKSDVEQPRSSFGGSISFLGGCILWYVLLPPPSHGPIYVDRVL